jgi:hypothetical protein
VGLCEFILPGLPNVKPTPMNLCDAESWGRAEAGRSGDYEVLVNAKAIVLVDPSKSEFYAESVIETTKDVANVVAMIQAICRREPEQRFARAGSSPMYYLDFYSESPFTNAIESGPAKPLASMGIHLGDNCMFCLNREMPTEEWQELKSIFQKSGRNFRKRREQQKD